MIIPFKRHEAACLHTHTIFCDGKADVETMCSAAYTKGLSSLGFSSHAPITKKTGINSDWHMKEEELGKYIDTVEAARKRWKEKLKIFLGLEVDYIKGYCSPSDSDIQALPVDYLIGSIHYLFSPKNGEPFCADEYSENFGNVLEHFNNDGKALCEAYYDAYNSMVTDGGSDILGHLDLIKKNNRTYNFFSAGENWYKKCMVITADTIAFSRSEAEKNGSRIPVVEVNTGAVIRGYTAEPYPSSDFLKMLNERNIPLVLNADAHAPEHLGGAYETSLQCMMDSGYTSVLFFEGRQNGKALWRKEPI